MLAPERPWCMTSTGAARVQCARGSRCSSMAACKPRAALRCRCAATWCSSRASTLWARPCCCTTVNAACLPSAGCQRALGARSTGAVVGLSPLTRGNRRYRARWWGRSGPIPAHAGEPKSQVGAGYVSRAYPRSRGGTWNAPPSEWTMTGLSPLTRGNLGLGGEGEAGAGPIPAHAGEPSQARRSVGVTGAYPRSRGGTCT